MELRRIYAGAAFAAACLFHLPAHAYTITGSVNGDPFTAMFSLSVSGDQATSGTGTISGGGLTGTQSLTLITLSSNGVENDGGGLLGYRSNDGTDWFDADTTVPIDTNGLIFAIGPNPVGFGTSQQFDIYNNGDNTFDVGFFGKADLGVAPAYYAYNIPVNFAVTGTDVSETPLPSTWTMMLIGLVALGLVAYRRQKQIAPIAA